MYDEFEPQSATRSRARLKIAITGPSGGGKTYGALALGTGLAQRAAAVRGNPKDVRLLGIDTENETMSLYSEEFPFRRINLREPYTSDRYVQAMQRGVRDAYEVVVVDSLSHQWNGAGGIQSRKDELDAMGGNSFTNWAKLSPEHTNFVEFIKTFPLHLIATMRSKQEYVLVDKEGKKVPQKVGMAPIQREGVEYEFSMVFDLAQDHRARVLKDRCRLNGRPLFDHEEWVDLTDPSVADRLWEWLNAGEDVEAEKLDREDILQIASALKFHRIDKIEFGAWLKQTMGYDSINDIPKTRMRECMYWIQKPKAEQSNAEKIARQTMRTYGWDGRVQAEFIAKHRMNWEVINQELEKVVMDQTPEFAAEDESQDPNSPPAQRTEGELAPDIWPREPGEEPGTIYEPPKLITTPKAAERRETQNREYFHITLSEPVEGKTEMSCWHGSRFAALQNCAGQECEFLVSMSKKGYLTVDEVVRVGNLEYEYVNNKHRVKQA